MYTESCWAKNSDPVLPFLAALLLLPFSTPIH